MDVAVLAATLTTFLRWLVGLQRQRPERVTSPESRTLLPARTGRACQSRPTPSSRSSFTGGYLTLIFAAATASSITCSTGSATARSGWASG